MKFNLHNRQKEAPVCEAEVKSPEKEAVDAICADINDIYSVDRATQTVTIIRQASWTHSLDKHMNKKFGYDDAVRAYVSQHVFSKDRESVLASMEFSAICKRLQENESVSIFYRVLRDDKLHYFRMKCNRIGDAESFKTIIFAFMPEDFETSQTQMLHTLETDEITGLYNKQAFYHHAAELLDKNPNKDYDLIVTDVENFKLVNRVYGRVGGDSLLKYLAGCYSSVSRGGICARYGSDQFVILSEVREGDRRKNFRELIDGIRAHAAIPNVFIRYGVNHRVDRRDSVAEMCDKAVLAMDKKNNFHDNPIMLYNKEVIRQNIRQQMFESGFERALAEKEFVVWCQPKYNAFTKRMTSAEALVRWKTDEGFISPGEFIPLFEQDGLIVRLDEYVFRYVCQRQKALIDAGKDPIPVSVNVSRATMYTTGSVEKYREIIETIGVDKRLVPLELTESATIENFQVTDLVNRLRDAGFVLYLDDFGSGYSSLSSLSTLRFDALKLDKTLIDGIGDTRADEILRHIIALAHFFQMEVVAEGVEQTYQYNFLKKLSCDTIQGYYFSRAVPFDNYLSLYNSQAEEASEMIGGEELSGDAGMGSLSITNETKMQYLSAMAGIYMTMHVIDLQEDTVVEFATTTNVKEHVNRAHDAAGQMQAAMTATVSPDYLQAVLEFTDLNTIAERMKGKRTLSAEFVGKHFGWFQARFTTVTADDDDKPIVLIYTTQVIEADKRVGTEENKDDPLIRACRTDELTGVFNRSAFDEDIKILSDPANPTLQNRPNMAAIMVDINGLKAANDRYGRTAGDELVWGTADTLNTVLGKESRIYRIGGDRFAAMFCADDVKLARIREEYDSAVGNWMGNEIRSLSTSYGIVTKRECPDMSLEELLTEADRRRLEYKARHKTEQPL